MKRCYKLDINNLFYKFPGFIFREDRVELVGYNPKTYIHMVIEDGLCVSSDRKWMVSQYKIKNPETFNWMENKYILDENIADKILEKWIEL